MKLYQALKTVINEDSGYFRQLVFQDFASRNFRIKSIMCFYKLAPHFIKGILVYSYGLKSYLFSPKAHNNFPILALYEYKNERRQIDFLEANYGTQIFDILKSSFTYLFSNIRGLRFLFAIRFIRFALKLTKKYDFLVCCRVMSTFFYYIKFKEVFKKYHYKGVLVSSDRNPYAMGLVYAAKTFDIKTFYITHGHLPEKPPLLCFDSSFLDGPALMNVYKRSGDIRGQVTFKGCEGEYRPLELMGINKASPVIGIFQSLLSDPITFIELIKDVEKYFSPSIIIVRLHPNEIIRNKQIISQLEKIPFVDISMANQLATYDLKKCDFIIAGNSSVHLTSLTYGVPSIYIKGIDIVPHDFYLFVKLGIIPYFESANETLLSEVNNFYQGDWSDRFKFFNSSYSENNDKISVSIKHVLEKAIL